MVLPPPIVSPVSSSGCTWTRDSDDALDKNSWVIAVCLAVLAAFTNNLGLNLQKLAWRKSQSSATRAASRAAAANASDSTSPPPKGRSFSGFWACGMSLILLASAFDFAALGFGPQSVIAPLGALTMVANAFIAPCMNKEKLQPGIIKATGVILVGCIVAVGAASHDNMICTLDALFSLYLTSQFCVYCIVVILLLSGLLLFARHCEHVERECGKESIEYTRLLKFHRISYACAAGLFGAQSVLFARTVTQAFGSSMRGGELFLLTAPIYVIIFLLVFCLVMQIYWLNQGLARFDSLYNVPVFTSTWIVGTVLGGGVFYNEFSNFNVYQAIFFPLGVLLCCVGVFYLALGGSTTSHASTTVGLDGTVDGGGSGKKLDASTAASATLSSFDEDEEEEPLLRSRQQVL